MSHTVIYRGWISVSPPGRKKDPTVIFSPNRFFYRPKKHVITERIAQDAYRYGSYANVRIWAYHHKIDLDKPYFRNSYMGVMDAEYGEISSSTSYIYTNQYVNIGYFDLLEELAGYCHFYCILEITYNTSEFDMVSHEAELILLRS